MLIPDSELVSASLACSGWPPTARPPRWMCSPEQPATHPPSKSPAVCGTPAEPPAMRCVSIAAFVTLRARHGDPLRRLDTPEWRSPRTQHGTRATVLAPSAAIPRPPATAVRPIGPQSLTRTRLPMSPRPRCASRLSAPPPRVGQHPNGSPGAPPPGHGCRRGNPRDRRDGSSRPPPPGGGGGERWHSTRGHRRRQGCLASRWASPHCVGGVERARIKTSFPRVGLARKRFRKARPSLRRLLDAAPLLSSESGAPGRAVESSPRRDVDRDPVPAVEPALLLQAHAQKALEGLPLGNQQRR